MAEALKSAALRIFKSGISAVMPYKVVRNCLSISQSRLVVDNKMFDLKGKNLYCCGVGKAAFEMFRAVDDVVPQYLNHSILSLPIGQKNKSQHKWNSKVEMFFGAAHNIADENSMKAAKAIYQMAQNLTESEILIALISGGGSALLPLPVDGISLSDKQKVTVELARNAVSIHDMNTVRKALSKIKGGGLLRAAYPSKVVSLILSDIIGDPIDFIASGPTVPDTCSNADAWNIIKKYNLVNKIPASAREFLKARSELPTTSKPNYSEFHIKVVGSNKLALSQAQSEAANAGFPSIILTDALSGEARKRGEQIVKMIDVILGETKAFKPRDFHFASDFLNESSLSNLAEFATAVKEKREPFCLLFGGETTVTVRGHGTGGRNQEIAVSSSIALDSLFKKRGKVADVAVLACGTDGIDGPTDAAGGYGTAGLIAASSQEEARSYLDDNDAYNYLKKYNGLIFTGHTGTNVMDMIVAVVKPY